LSKNEVKGVSFTGSSFAGGKVFFYNVIKKILNFLKYYNRLVRLQANMSKKV